MSTTGTGNHDLEVMTLLPISDARLDQLKKATNRDSAMQKLANVWRSPRYRGYETQSQRRSLLAINVHGYRTIRHGYQWQRVMGFQSVSGCTVCNATKAHQQKEPLKSYLPPSLPWELIGVDLFHWNGMDYLALGDSYSGWFDFASLDDTCASRVIEVLKRQFSIHGIPRIVISDNARQFDCFAFKQSAQSWGFQHTTSSPNFPQSNGLAESSVKRAKQLLEKTKREGSDLYRNLLNIRNVPTNPQLKPGQVVRLQSPKGHDQLGIVQKHSGNPRSYIVNAQGTLYRRNRRHLLPVPEPPPQQRHLPDFYLPPQDPLPQPAIAQAPPPQPAVTRSGRISNPNPKYT